MQGIMTVEEVAKLLRVSEWKVYKLLEAGDIKGFRVGRQWRMPVREVDDYVSRELAGAASNIPSQST